MNHPYSNHLSKRRIAAAHRIDPSASEPGLDFATVKAAARGQWPSLLQQLGVSPEALRDHHGPCPGCGGVDRFRFDDRDDDGSFICSNGGGDPLAGDGFHLLEHAYDWPPAQALTAVAEALGLSLDRSSTPQSARKHLPAPAKILEPEELQRRKNKLNAVWSASYPLDHPLAEPARAYLAARRLADILHDAPNDVRLHPQLTYWQPTGSGSYEVVGDFPALVALVRDPNGQPISLHRTWLTPAGDQKAAVAQPKKLMTGLAPLAGAAIRLYAADHRLAIAEGIETALSIRVALPDWPVWSAINSHNMKKLIVPDSVTEVVICADQDQAGMNAAHALADRLVRDKTVRLIVPEQGDFNDVLRGV